MFGEYEPGTGCGPTGNKISEESVDNIYTNAVVRFDVVKDIIDQESQFPPRLDGVTIKDTEYDNSVYLESKPDDSLNVGKYSMTSQLRAEKVVKMVVFPDTDDEAFLIDWKNDAGMKKDAMQEKLEDIPVEERDYLRFLGSTDSIIVAQKLRREMFALLEEIAKHAYTGELEAIVHGGDDITGIRVEPGSDLELYPVAVVQDDDTLNEKEEFLFTKPPEI